MKEIKTVIAEAHTRQGRRPFVMSAHDRLHGLYLIGQTGVGKSTLLENLARRDAEAGHGFCVIDPHGDLAAKLAATFPDAISWNAADPNYRYGYNPLTHVSKQYRPLVAAGVVDALKRQWEDAWGPRMEHLLRYSILGLLDVPSSDFRDVLTLFIDKNRRAEMLTHVSDPEVRRFWEVEWKALRYQNSPEGIVPITSKLSAFLSHPLVRRAVCEPEEPLRFRRIMDNGEKLIVNLATGQLGVEAANVLGGLILAGLSHAAYSRADIPEQNRRAFFISVDEFASFSTAALPSMLPQLRKFKAGLTMAHQHLDQLEGKSLAAILGNVGSILVFRVGAQDAPTLATQIGGREPFDLINLPNHECAARILSDGVRTKTFTAYVPRPYE